MANSKISGVYIITNTLNGMKYIGQSIDISRRWADHRRDATNKKKKSPLYWDMRVYGINNFRFEIIEVCSKPFLDIREIYWIKVFNTYRGLGYNRGPGGKIPSDKFLAAGKRKRKRKKKTKK